MRSIKRHILFVINKPDSFYLESPFFRARHSSLEIPNIFHDSRIEFLPIIPASE